MVVGGERRGEREIREKIVEHRIEKVLANGMQAIQHACWSGLKMVAWQGCFGWGRGIESRE